MNNVVHVVYVDDGARVTVVVMADRDNPVTFARPTTADSDGAGPGPNGRTTLEV